LNAVEEKSGTRHFANWHAPWAKCLLVQEPRAQVHLRTAQTPISMIDAINPIQIKPSTCGRITPKIHDCSIESARYRVKNLSNAIQRFTIGQVSFEVAGNLDNMSQGNSETLH
jgi:hypothetical protein